MKFPVGTKFISRSNRKIKRVQEVVDYHITLNLAGEVVRKRYVAAHEFMGQMVKEYDIPEATIAMAEILEIPEDGTVNGC